MIGGAALTSPHAAQAATGARGHPDETARFLRAFDLEGDAPVLAEMQATGILDVTEFLTLCKHLQGAAAPDGRVLEIGCGDGGVSRLLAERLPIQLWGLDISAPLLSEARRQDQGLNPINWMCGSFTSLPFSPRTFSAIFGLEVLHFAADASEVLMECARVSREGSVLFLTLCLAEPTEISTWREKLLSAGYALIEWADLSREWRARLERRHMRRLANRERFITKLGLAQAVAVLKVSRWILTPVDEQRPLDQRWRYRLIATRLSE